jgi:hypothetical protein
VERKYIGGVSLSNLNLSGWERKNIKLSSKGLIYKIMDFEVKKYRWMTLNEIKNESNKSGVIDTKSYVNFVKEAEQHETALSASDRNFEKHILKKFYRDDENKVTDAEIIETSYYTSIGVIVSVPKLVKKITGADFNSKTESWGIDDDILLAARKMEVEDIQLVDEYNNVYFYTSMSKYQNLGDKMSWGKVYLPLKSFQVKRYGDKIPFYAKYLRSVKQ